MPERKYSRLAVGDHEAPTQRGLYTPICDGTPHMFSVRVEASQGPYTPRWSRRRSRSPAPSTWADRVRHRRRVARARELSVGDGDPRQALRCGLGGTLGFGSLRARADRDGPRLLRTSSRRVAAVVRTPRRFCIREKQPRRADCSYPCDWPLRCPRVAGANALLVSRHECEPGVPVRSWSGSPAAIAPRLRWRASLIRRGRSGSQRVPVWFDVPARCIRCRPNPSTGATCRKSLM
jgi:hypothetical protein